MKTKKQTKPAAKTGKPEQTASAPALPEKPAHTIELNPTDQRGVFTAKIGGKRAVVAFTARPQQRRQSLGKRDNRATAP